MADNKASYLNQVVIEEERQLDDLGATAAEQVS